jgi:threonine/homoserine/homoserine lactone efflux protein
MMDLTSLTLFVGALFVAAASPGPTIAAIVARVLGRGMSGAIAFTAGIMLGEIVWLTVAILGLAVVAQTFQGVFLAIKYAGAAYLLYLAWKLWTAPVADNVVPDRADGKRVRLFFAGVAVTLGNPKVVVFYLALLPNIIDLAMVSVLGWLELSVVTLAVLAIVDGAYIALAARTRRLFTSPRAMRMVNRGSGAVMASAAVAIAAK